MVDMNTVILGLVVEPGVLVALLIVVDEGEVTGVDCNVVRRLLLLLNFVDTSVMADDAGRLAVAALIVVEDNEINVADRNVVGMPLSLPNVVVRLVLMEESG